MENSDTTTTTTTISSSSPPHSLSPSSSSPPPPPPSHQVVVSPCAACKILRRRCAEKCVLAPYFPPTDPLKFTTAHRVFGTSNIIKFLQSLMNCWKACVDIVKAEYMKMKEWFETCCNTMAMFLISKWNNIKDWAKKLLSIIERFSKNIWTKINEIFTIDRMVAILALGMEVASAIMEQISSAKEQHPKVTNHQRIYVIALLATVFSLLGLVLALLEMIHKALSCRRWINCTFLWVNIVFSLVQTITSLVHFIFLQFSGKNDPIKFSLLPIVFALIVVVIRFIPHYTDTIEADLSHGNQTHNVIEETVDGENVINCTSMHELC